MASVKRASLRAAALLLLLVCFPHALTTQAPAKPVQSEVINTYFKSPPDTLTEMITTADLVVRGRVVGGSPRDTLAAPPKGTHTRTAYHLKVFELLHAKESRAFDADTIDIIRSGGERDRGTYIERSYQSGFPPFEIGHEYVMFLTWNASLNAWVPAFGPDSVYDLAHGIVESPGKANVTRMLTGKNASEFLERIRRFGR